MSPYHDVAFVVRDKENCPLYRPFTTSTAKYHRVSESDVERNLLSGHPERLMYHGKNYPVLDWCFTNDSERIALIQTAPDEHRWIVIDARTKAAEPKPIPLIPDDNAGRKAIPICTGVLDYFPAALLEVAKVSQAGNEQHNPGQPLHWARGKSMNQSDTMLRHYMQRGTVDTDGVRHLAKAAWRVLAELQLELEAAGYPVARGAK